MWVWYTIAIQYPIRTFSHKRDKSRKLTVKHGIWILSRTPSEGSPTELRFLYKGLWFPSSRDSSSSCIQPGTWLWDTAITSHSHPQLPQNTGKPTLSQYSGQKGLEESRLPFLVHENLQAEARGRSGFRAPRTGATLLQGRSEPAHPRRLEPAASDLWPSRLSQGWYLSPVTHRGTSTRALGPPVSLPECSVKPRSTWRSEKRRCSALA